MTPSSPSSRPGPADSEPADNIPPTLPPSASDIVPWGDTDIGAPPGPAAAFPTNTPTKNDDQMPTIGHIGRYALKYKIGAGGLGTVYAAHDPLLSRLIAIKTLNLEIAPEERDAFNALFLNEARAAGGLSHPHIVTVFDAGVSDQSAYIAMELLKGRDLRQLRQEGWRPTPMQAAMIVRRVADALAYAHSKGVVHRDIKPANIFMVGRTQPRVLDFGIARIAHQHDGAGDIAAGSPYYMAPEQARQQTVDRRADVFSLGVVLYELLTDRKPFRGSTLSEITTAVIEHKPPRADEVEPNVPTALAEITARAMEKDPEHRYRSARALSRELRHWLDENGNSPESVPAESGELPPAERRSRRVTLAAGLAVGVGAVLVWLAMHGSSPAPAETMAGAPAVARPAPARPVTTPPPAPEPAPVLAAAPAEAPAVVTAPAADVPAPPVEAASAAAPTVAPARAAAPRAAPAKPAPAKDARPVRDTRVAAAAPAATGSVRIAVSPWGNVEVNGAAVGITPPLNELTLPEGRHQVTIRNADFPPFVATVTVVPGQSVNLRHKFGS
ncbi:serine/threonine-protein kinase [Piscinibacter sp.]|uniref:serine/threonine-protein kinase n=1 Tax=Piscinibacter sp. TaxID=1903157 RepID=UPI0025FD8E95|nr:serine/threonine-protein kinase [Piscinibacter sp.]HOY37290.1 serine/threonine-protein kinase [Piscinibacter sp.]HPG79243.1 serine/threonine-protein kinase [Piscinibacter sp.]